MFGRSLFTAQLLHSLILTQKLQQPVRRLLFLCVMRTICTQELVPVHNVLRIIRLRHSVMHIVRFRIEETGYHHVVARVVERRKHSSSQNKENDGVQVRRDKEDCHQVKILAQDEFNGVDIDGVQIATRRRLLLVVMLVNPGIKPTNMQEPVKHLRKSLR